MGRRSDRGSTKVTRLTAITTNTETGWFLDLNDEVVYRIGLFSRKRLTTWMVVCSKKLAS